MFVAKSTQAYLPYDIIDNILLRGCIICSCTEDMDCWVFSLSRRVGIFHGRSGYNGSLDLLCYPDRWRKCH